MRRFRLAGALVFMFALGIWAVTIQAYTTRGLKWGVTDVRYYVNPQNLYVPQAEAVAAIQRAADSWNSQSNANVNLVYAGPTSGSSLTLNRVNEIFFRNDSSGALAETYWWYDGSGHLIDADIVFHQNYVFGTTTTGCSNGYYIENTGTHEFGHALGLAHSTVDLATMWPYSGGCETTRMTLDQDDIAGIESLYPPSGNSPPPTVVSAPTAPSNPSPTSGATGTPTNTTLSWISTGATSYDVYLNGALYAANRSSASASVSSLVSGATYSWSVVAKNSGGSTAGPTWSFTTQTATTTTTTTPPTTTESPTKGNRGRRGGPKK